MLGLYINSFMAGVGLGIIQAIIFYREAKRVQAPEQGARAFLFNKLVVFAMRYLLLFIALWILVFKYQLNIYLGAVGFFAAFWVMLLKKVKDCRES